MSTIVLLDLNGYRTQGGNKGWAKKPTHATWLALVGTISFSVIVRM
jgi:hypothetical protein